jgi:3'-5' exonuclease
MIRVALDLETLPTDNPKVMARITDAVKPPGQYKKEDSIKAWWVSEGAEKKLDAIARTALDGSYGRIAIIGFQIGDNEPQFITTENQSEQAAINAFGDTVCAQVAAATGVPLYTSEMVQYIGHNISGFDLRFLWKRAVITQASLPPRWPMERYSKHVYDTMIEWAGWGEYIKQSELESIFGIERPEDIDGSQVADLIAAGDWKTVTQHCQYDIENLGKIYKRMTA